MSQLISTKNIEHWRQKAAMRLYQAGKQLYQFARAPLQTGNERPSLLFIIGCQRSGTTLVTRLFERDLNARVYAEHSALSNRDRLDGLRLNPLPQVDKAICASRFPLVVMKPLVETQNTHQLLNYFPGAKALWMYRDYNDVAMSNIHRFGLQNGINNLRYIVQQQEENWRVQGLAPEYRALVNDTFSDEMNPYDAAALFWIVRNSFFFTLDLASHPAVRMLRYRDLVTEPLQSMTAVYNFIQRPFPGSRLLQEVHQTSLGKGQRITLSPHIQTLCDDMLARLEASYQISQSTNQPDPLTS